MFLIDAVYINNSGGKVLLDYLITEFEKTNLSIFYLLDRRIQDNHPLIKTSNIINYLSPNILERHRFYVLNKKRFNKILCFGNVPPNIRMNSLVYTYFHQKLFIEIPRYLSLKQRMLLKVKSLFLRHVIDNTDYWIVQSNSVKSGLLEKFEKIKEKSLFIVPFYPSLIPGGSDVERNENSFIYVSDGHEYKNHSRLIEAFRLFFIEEGRGELHLTINNSFAKLISRINLLRRQGFPIINHGFQDRDKVFNLYRASKYSIFPSLEESFGLGVIESIECGCILMAGDLPYIHAICEPSLTFDPNNVNDIKESFKTALNSSLRPTKQVVFNQIGRLISFFKDDSL